MYGKIQQHLQAELQDIENSGLFKRERIITTPKARSFASAPGKRC